jgi:hypothetical protein
MTKKIAIEFEKGGKFIATLMEDKAPKTCETVWKNLPFSGRIGHAYYSGMLMYLLLKTRFKELENAQCIGLQPGDVVYITPFFGDVWHDELAFIYGHALVQDKCGYLPANHFARITEGSLEELAAVGTRIREEGREEVTVTRYSEE